MSLRRFIICDECADAGVEIPETMTAKQIRLALGQEGWDYRKGGKDYCPICHVLLVLEAEGQIERVPVEEG